MIVAVAVGQGLHEHPQVTRDDAGVVTPLGLGPQRVLGRLRRAFAEIAAGRSHRGRTVLDGPRYRAPVRDRAVPVAPQVHGVAQDVHAAGLEVRGQDDGDVLEEHAFGEREGVPVPEVPPEDLVAGDAIAEQLPVARDVGGAAGGGHDLAEHRGLLLRAVRAQPVDVARHEVGSGLVEHAQHPLVRLGRDHVVAVDEGEMGAARLARARVAGGTEPGIGLVDEPEAAVAFGVAAGDLPTAVRGAVVDHDDLEIRHGLPGQRLEAGTEVILDVVDGDDDAESGCHALRTFLPENGDGPSREQPVSGRGVTLHGPYG